MGSTHDPEKCEAVFGQDHASGKTTMIPTKHAPDLIRGAKRFSDKIMRKERIS
jgi:hypothetical protein